MRNLDLIQDAISAIANENNETALARLKQFLALNTPKVSGGKVKIYDWCNPKAYQKPFNGVYHDQKNEVAIATDSHVLLVSKPDFVKGEDKNVVIDKKGNEISLGAGTNSWNRYPDYNMVFHKEVVPFEVDKDKVVKLLNKERVDKKLGKKYFAFNIGTNKLFYLSPANCKLLISLPDGKFYVLKDEKQYGNRALQYESNDGLYRAMLMPMWVNANYIGQDAVIAE